MQICESTSIIVQTICFVCLLLISLNGHRILRLYQDYLVKDLKTLQNTNEWKDSFIVSPTSYTEEENATIPNKYKSDNFIPYRQAINENIYMYSAILIEVRNFDFNERRKLDVLINAWEKKALLRATNFICNFYLKDNTKFDINSTHKRITYFSYEALHSVQYICPVKSSSIRSVSVKYGSNMYEGNEENYIKVDLPMKDESGLAVCNQFTFGNIDARHMLEWFEFQRLVGVDKVLTYTYKLNRQAMAVLEYYESIGYAVVIRDLDFPLKEELPRDVGQENVLAWVDTQVVMHDCQFRLYGYKYVAVLDKDELFVPNVTKYGLSLKQFLDDIFRSDLAGVSSLVKMHMTSWKPYNQSSELFIGKYLLSTAPVHDRVKCVYMPSRTKLGSVEVRSMIPSGKYKRKVLPVTQLVLHHYRKCRKEYWFSKNMNANKRNSLYYNDATDDKCFGFRSFYEKDMELIMGKIKTSVLELQRKLLL